MNNFFKLILKFLVILLIAVCAGTIIMIILYSLPIDRIVRHVSETITVFSTRIINNWAGGRYSALSNSTDSIMINNAICRGYTSVIDNALLNPAYSYSDSTRINNLISYINGISGSYLQNYGRYWHGYLLYMIPGLLLFDINGLKMAMMFVQFFLVVILMYELGKRNPIYMFIYGIVILFINPITTVLTFQEADIYSIAIIFSIVVLKYNEKLNKNNRILYLFLINGICVAFIDFLTSPLVAWGLPLITYLLINKKDNANNIKSIICISFSWILGYAGMWFGKWIIATIFTNTNLIIDGLNSVLQRTSSTDDSSVSFTYGQVIMELIYSVNDTPYLFLYLLGFGGLIVYSFVNRKKIVLKNAISIIPYMLIAIAPFVWYFIVRNHAYIHPWLEYRHLAITLYCLLVSTYKMFNY